jgi:hypothetical protein
VGDREEHPVPQRLLGGEFFQVEFDVAVGPIVQFDIVNGGVQVFDQVEAAPTRVGTAAAAIHNCGGNPATAERSPVGTLSELSRSH